MKTRESTRAWVVANQSQSPQFQSMLEALTPVAGFCELLTGMPYPSRTPRLRTIKAPSYRRASLVARAVSWFQFTCVAAYKLVFRRRPSFCVVTTNPPSLPALARFLSVIRGVPYVLFIWDLYPDHAIRRGWLRKHGVAARLWQRVNRSALLHATVVVTLGERMRQQLKMEAADATIVVIPSWADVEHIRPVPKRQNSFALEHRQVDKVTVLYSGNIGLTHGVEHLAEAARLLKDIPDLCVMIVGDGLGLAAVRQVLGTADVDNVVLLPWQPWELLPRSLAVADIAVVIQEHGSESLSLPSKTYAALAAGSAILAVTSDESDLGRLIHKYKVGMVCGPDPRAIAEAIRELYADPVRLASMRERARAAAELHFSGPAVLRQLTEAMRPVLPPNSE